MSLTAFNFMQDHFAHRFNLQRHLLANMELCDFCTEAIQKISASKYHGGRGFEENTSWVLDKKISFRQTSLFCRLCKLLVEAIPETAVDEAPLSLLLILDYTEDFSDDDGAHFGPFPSRVASSCRLDSLNWEHSDQVVLSLWADSGTCSPS